MQFDLSPRNPPLDSLLVRIKELRNRPSIRRPPRLRRNNIDQQEESEQNDNKVEPPTRAQSRDDTSPDAETNGHPAHKTKTPDSQPNPHPTSLPPHIVVKHDFLVRLRGHQRRAEEIEERGEEIDVGEA